MTRVLEYAARRPRRGTLYANASIVLAASVLIIPVAFAVANAIMEYLVNRPKINPAFFRLEGLLISGPFLLTLALPLFGLCLGIIALSLRCHKNHLVFLGVLVNISGLVAAIAVLLQS